MKYIQDESTIKLVFVSTLVGLMIFYAFILSRNSKSKYTKHHAWRVYIIGGISLFATIYEILKRFF